MAESIDFNVLEYNEEKRTVDDIINANDLPHVVKVCKAGTDDHAAGILEEKYMLLQRMSTEQYAHIKVLKFYDNAKMQSEKGAEYVSEHETYVGNEYLLPMNFPGKFKCVRRPGSRGRYLTIKHVISDCPAFVKVETDTTARLSSDTSKSVTIPAKTILELKRTYKKETIDTFLLECSDGVTSYEFEENDEVNFTVFHRNKFYRLNELATTTMLPKVILFIDVDPEDAVLKNNELRSACLTMVEGPLEILGFADMKYLVCWVRNRYRKTYETVLLPQSLWNKVIIQKRHFCDEFEKQLFIKRKYGQCFASDVFNKSLYITPVHMSEMIWLRSPALFKRNLNDAANRLYEIVDIPFEASSSDGDDEKDDHVCSASLSDGDDEKDDHVYSEIAEPPPPLPPKVPLIPPEQTLSGKTSHLLLKKVKAIFMKGKGPKSECNLTNTNQSHSRYTPQVPPKRFILPQAASSSPNYLIPHSDDMESNKYTQLQCSRNHMRYERLKCAEQLDEKSDESWYPKRYNDMQSNDTAERVLNDTQSAENFFHYSVAEVSFCFEYCGLTKLAEVCTQQKLDGSFFRGFNDWNVFHLSHFDTMIVNKVIHDGWRPTTD